MNALIDGSEEVTALGDTQARKRGEELSRSEDMTPRVYHSFSYCSRVSEILIHAREEMTPLARPLIPKGGDTGKQYEW